MTEQEFKDFLIESQQEIIEAYEGLLENAPTPMLRGLMLEALAVQKSVGRKLQKLKKAEVSKSKNPRPNAFTKKESKKSDSHKKNKDVRPNAFSRKDADNTKEETKVIKNKPRPNPFEEKVIESSDEGKPKKKPKRLNKRQIQDVDRLVSEGFNALQISDKLWIDFGLIQARLKTLGKPGGNLLHTTNGEEKSLEDEVKDSRND